MEKKMEKGEEKEMEKEMEKGEEKEQDSVKEDNSSCCQATSSSQTPPH